MLLTESTNKSLTNMSKKNRKKKIVNTIKTLIFGKLAELKRIILEMRLFLTKAGGGGL